MPKKDFTDKRVEKKESSQAKKDRKALKRSKQESQKALDKHGLGWQTRDGKEF